MVRRVGGGRAQAGLAVVVCLWMVSGCNCGDGILVPVEERESRPFEIVDPDLTPTKPDCVDEDGDGVGVGADCGRVDCDDTDPNVGSEATASCYSGPAGTEGVGACSAGTRTCTNGVWEQTCTAEVVPADESCDGIDNDCDGEVDEAVVRSCFSGPKSLRGVGACVEGTQTCANGTWGACVGDGAPSAEVCDGVDNDCNGFVDEALVRSCFTGPEGSGGVGTCAFGSQACVGGAWSACVGETLPGPEVCDGLDNDCDGDIDEGLVRSCYDGPAGTEGVGVCAVGTETCVAGTWGACSGQVTPSAESCDGLDNDCDGTVDEALVRACYSGPPGTEGVGICSGGQQICAAGAWGACTGEVLPVAETCDNVDNDCDGQVDDHLVRSCYPGPNGTPGVGVCAAGTQSCQAGSWGECTGATLPGTEICDTLDNDCDGQVDENVTVYSQNGSNQPVDPITRPVDIIFVIDNSCSMSNEIAAVEQNINVNFANIIAASGLDYRVIMLSDYGSSQLEVCVKAPLGGSNNCGGNCPTNTSRFFHYSVPIGSHDSLYRILDTFDRKDGCNRAPNGWRDWLRPDAIKFFIEITDDEPIPGNPGNPNSTTSAYFDQQLLALSPTHFGTAQARNYVFHSIAGLKENSPRLEPWLPTQPLVTQTCTANGGDVRAPGIEFQELSKLTGGYRYPICEYQSFNTVFEKIAQAIIVGAQIECSFKVPIVPPDSHMDNTTLELVPTNGGPTRVLQHVADQAACAGESFYTVGTEIHLCPDACALWRNDPTALVNVLFSCTNQIVP